MDKQDDNQKVLVGFVLGAVTGAAAALLIAPSVNEETKRKLADKAAPLKNLLEDNADTLVHYGLGMLKTFANGKAAGAATPLLAVLQALAPDKKRKDKGDKAARKEAKKKNKRVDEDELQ